MNCNLQKEKHKKDNIVYIMRGIAVFLIVIAHLQIVESNAYIYKIIYSFHIPVFIFVSGFFMNNGNCNVITFLKKKSKRLLLPLISYFFVYQTFNFTYLGFRNLIGREVFFLGYGFDDIGKALVYQNAFHFHHIQMGNFMWFLPFLFVLYILYYYFDKATSLYSWKTRISVLMLCQFAVFVFVSPTIHSLIPFSIDTAIYSLIFVELGRLYYRYPQKYEFTIIQVITLISCVASIALFQARIDFAQLEFSNPLADSITSLLGILMVAAIAVKLNNHFVLISRFFTILGKYSLEIYVLNFIIFRIVQYASRAFMLNNYIYVFIAILSALFVPVLLSKYLFSKNKYTSLMFMGT